MNIFILSHSTGIKGPGDFLEEYLLQKKHKVFKLEHPLDVYKDKRSTYTINGLFVSSSQRSDRGLFNYFFDYYSSLICLVRTNIDVFVGVNNFDTFLGILARILLRKKIEKIIYFASDYSENRFSNRFLNLLYVEIERLVLKHSDVVISNTERAEKKRLSLGLSEKKSLVIPNGVYLKKPVFKQKKIDRGKFIYVGNVTKEHGLLQIVTILSSKIEELVVIGQGDQWEELKNLTIKKKIKTTFFYKKTHEFVISYMQSFNGFGLAPYIDSTWTFYSSPLKIVEYVVCGIPVITSDVTEISKLIQTEKLGVVYKEMDIEKLWIEISKLDTNDFYKKSKKTYARFNYEHLYKQIPL